MTTLALNDMFQRWFFRGPSSTETVRDTDQLLMFLWWHSIFWFVLLMGLTLYFVVRYRRVPGKPAEPSPSHHTALETFWTTVPTLLLVVIFLYGFWGYIDKLVPHGDALELNVKGWKWGWGITYPNGAQSPEVARLDVGGREFPVFVVPEGAEVKLRMSSQDVIHSFWIPDLRVKMDVMPNRYTGYGFTTPTLNDDDPVMPVETGQPYQYRDLWVFCAEYCGDNHSEMAAIMRVVPQAVFNTTIIDWGTPDIGIETGQAVFASKCASCHRVDGTENKTAPSWLGGASYMDQQYGFGYPVRLNNGEVVDRDANYIRESILNPAAKVVAGYAANMPSFDGLLNDAQLESLILYYQSLSDRGPKLDLGEGGEADAADPASDEPATADPTDTGPTDPATTDPAGAP